MTLEDILKIDTCPFDEDVLDECVAGEYNASYEIRSSLCNLILRYINLFWEKYQSDRVRTYAPDRIVGTDDVDEDEFVLWVEEAHDIMCTAANVNGWQCAYLRFYSGDIELSDAHGNGKGTEAEQFHEAYMKFLDEYEMRDYERKIFENEEELVRDVACYTDEAIIGILRNEKLAAYNALKKKNAAMIQEVCKEEDLHISELEHDIWMPFWVCFVEEKKEYEGEEYGVFVLGSDGYNYYHFDRFDPNWVCKAFVMDQLLALALTKLEAYIATKKLVA